MPARALRTVILMLLLAAGSPTAAEDERQFVRVELIVFTHQTGASDAWPVDDIRSFADWIDPRFRAFARQQLEQRTAEGAQSSQQDARAALEVLDALADLESGESPLAESLLLPEPWIAVDELSGPMRRALERLERSGLYRVRARLGWHQPIERGQSRRVRIHDSRPIAADWIALDPLGQPTRAGRRVAEVADLFPDIDYRLDGGIRIYSRQFLHADLTLHWRESRRVGPAGWMPTAGDDALSVHELDQSRTIRAGRLEYFDSEWLGAVVLVTPLASAESDDASAAEDDAVPLP
jgi:hypothetical protein